MAATNTQFEKVLARTRECESAGSSPSSHEKKERRETYRANAFDVWAGGLAAVIGAQFYGWNEALSIGFGSFLVGQLLMGFAYVCLVSSLGELVSSTAFTGGAYGMARVVLGFYPGFIMAIFEFAEYSFYTAMSVVYISRFLVAEFGWSENYLPLICFVFYVIAGGIVIMGDRTFWTTSTVLGIMSVVIPIVYFCGAVGHTDFIENASLHRSSPNSNVDNWFAGGLEGFMTVMPFTVFPFVGIESMALVTDLVENPRVNVRIGMVYATWTLFAVFLLLLFVACAGAPGLRDGAFAEMEQFMETGFSSFGVSARATRWLVLAPQIAMAFGYILPYSQILHVVAQSNVLPRWLMLRGQEDHSWAVVVGCTLSFLACMVSLYFPSLDLVLISIILAFSVYLCDLYAYYKLMTDFAEIQREYSSPFGKYGAIFAGAIFLLGLIASVFFQASNGYITLAYIVSIFVLVSIYYFMVAQHEQVISEMEQKSLMVFHVIVFNKGKRQRMKQGRAHKQQNKKKSWWRRLLCCCGVMSKVADDSSERSHGGSANNNKRGRKKAQNARVRPDPAAASEGSANTIAGGLGPSSALEAGNFASTVGISKMSDADSSYNDCSGDEYAGHDEEGDETCSENCSEISSGGLGEENRAFVTQVLLGSMSTRERSAKVGGVAPLQSNEGLYFSIIASMSQRSADRRSAQSGKTTTAPAFSQESVVVVGASAATEQQLQDLQAIRSAECV